MARLHVAFAAIVLCAASQVHARKCSRVPKRCPSDGSLVFQSPFRGCQYDPCPTGPGPNDCGGLPCDLLKAMLPPLPMNPGRPLETPPAPAQSGVCFPTGRAPLGGMSDVREGPTPLPVNWSSDDLLDDIAEAVADSASKAVNYAKRRKLDFSVPQSIAEGMHPCHSFSPMRYRSQVVSGTVLRVFGVCSLGDTARVAGLPELPLLVELYLPAEPRMRFHGKAALVRRVVVGRDLCMELSSADNMYASILSTVNPNIPPPTGNVAPPPMNADGSSPLLTSSGFAVCTADARVCPDGTHVIRTGPYCHFQPCPSTENQGMGDTLAVALGCVGGVLLMVLVQAVRARLRRARAPTNAPTTPDASVQAVVVEPPASA
jgi:hypothetical protein